MVERKTMNSAKHIILRINLLQNMNSTSPLSIISSARTSSAGGPIREAYHLRLCRASQQKSTINDRSGPLTGKAQCEQIHSALPLKADIACRGPHGRLGPFP